MWVDIFDAADECATLNKIKSEFLKSYLIDVYLGIFKAI